MQVLAWSSGPSDSPDSSCGPERPLKGTLDTARWLRKAFAQDAQAGCSKEATAVRRRLRGAKRARLSEWLGPGRSWHDNCLSASHVKTGT